MTEWVAIAAGLTGAAACRIVASLAMRSPGDAFIRTNIDGRRVPVILGWAVVSGAIAGLIVAAAFFYIDFRLEECPGLMLCEFSWDVWLLAGIPLVGMGAAGYWDDRRGDERPRGFAGHLSALGGGAVTGGVVKLVGGAVVGILTMFIALDGFLPLTLMIAGALSIALTANLMNLLDRAPGRAGKAYLLLSVPLAFASSDWRFIAGGTIGAVVAALPLDLRAKGMLGDTGANAIGAQLGLGLMLVLSSSAGRWIVVGILMALNLASEKWSFSAVIERTPWLARLDHLGRK